MDENQKEQLGFKQWVTPELKILGDSLNIHAMPGTGSDGFAQSNASSTS